MGNKELIPPGLTFLADNITSKHNLLGAGKGAGARWAKGLNLPKEAETIFFAGCGYQYASELESLMSLIRRIDRSAVSTEMAMSVASFQKRLGIDAAGIYRRVMSRGGEEDAQPLLSAVKVLNKLGKKFGYLADDEPCCGGSLYCYAEGICRTG
jgi:Fe-S oxidoreductase